MWLAFLILGCAAAGSSAYSNASSDYTPELDASASSAQRDLYSRFSPYLPTLSPADYPLGTVRVYMFPGTGGDRTTCVDSTSPFYWTWYSTVVLVPILSGFESNSCGTKGTDPPHPSHTANPPAPPSRPFTCTPACFPSHPALDRVW